MTALRLDDAELGLDDPRLGAGWHAPEPDGRWTDGAASIAHDGARTLALRLGAPGRYWRGHRRARKGAA